VDQRGSCPACKRERERRRKRGTRKQRGYDEHWLKLVKVAIARQPWCSYCGTSQDLTGDHAVPVSKGGRAWTLADVIVACRPCNSRRGAREVPAFLSERPPNPAPRSAHISSKRG
jgi:5-methylcytosine-specific restriction enzyme A